MDLTYIIILVSAILVSLIAGVLISRYLVSGNMKKKEEEAQKRADEIVNEAKEKAEVIKKDKINESREKFLQMKSEHEKEVNKKNKNLQQQQQKVKEKEKELKEKEQALKKQEEELQHTKSQLEQKKEAVDQKKEELDHLYKMHVEELEKASGLSAQEAEEKLIENLKEEARTKAKSYIKEIMDEAKANATKAARKLVLETVQRVASEQTIENCVSVFHIDNDEMKGRIIGREGRNIRALEAATGVEIIVDDTPESIVLSAFDPVRREIARLSLHKLVSDGRIHPARIEEVVQKTQKEIDEEIKNIGEKTCIDMGIHGLHPDIIQLVGRMRYRSSYGQNLLQHSREVAKFCGIMAAELGLDAKKARRAGLLHDIGKVSEEDNETPHALLGARIAENHNEDPEVVNAIGAHHDEMEMNSHLSPIIQVCDGISGARPGARREVFESYLQRLKDLENIALSFDGVQKSYAIQAGRELRVIVESEKIDDSSADNLSFEISDKIQQELTYPGQVKVTVIRERRAVNYAK